MTDIHEYPKALYKGDTVDYMIVNALDSEEETAMREADWMDFADLKEGKVVEPSLNGENEALANAMERIAELEAENRELKLHTMTSDELKAILTDRKIEFAERASKETLLKLVIESE